MFIPPSDHRILPPNYIPSGTCVKESVLELLNHAPSISFREMADRLPYGENSIAEVLVQIAKRESSFNSHINYHGNASGYAYKAVFRVTPFIGEHEEVISILRELSYVSKLEYFSDPYEHGPGVICLTVYGSNLKEFFDIQAHLESEEMQENQLEEVHLECRRMEPFNGW